MENTSVKIKGRCLSCGSELSEPLFTLPNMPAGAQSMPSADELDRDKGIDLPLCRCPVCGLVQFDCEPVSYYRDAIRVAGLSDTMKNLRRADYRLVIEHYGKGGRDRKWLECGCSNGDFLQILSEFNVDIYGIEHGESEYDRAKQRLCNEGGVAESHIMKLFADNAELDIPGAPFDVFTSFNFLEHQPDPKSMLRCMYHNLADDGIGIITVPSFEYIIDSGRYYELIRDHIANYDMYAISHLCMSCGFEILERDYISIGDTIRLIVQKKADCADTEQIAGGLKNPTGELGNTLPAMDISDLKSDYERMSREIAGYMGDLARKGRSAALWGAGHQGLTIASTTVLKDHIKYIIDSSPVKQGRFAPASRLRIVPPQEYLRDPVDVIIIAAPGYAREIEQSIRALYKDTRRGIPAICTITDLTER